MKRTAVLFSLMFSLLFLNQLFAQKSDSSLHVGVYIGPSLPQGDYAQTHGDQMGYALKGIGAMFDVRTTLYKMSWVSSLIFSSNKTDANAMQDQLTDMGVVADDHFTIWALTGLGYRKALSDNVIIYGLGQLGLFHSNFPDVYTTDGINKTTYTYSTANTFGFALGTGLSVFKMNLAVRYCFAQPSYERSGDWLGQNGDKKVTIPSNNLFIMVGYEF